MPGVLARLRGFLAPQASEPRDLPRLAAANVSALSASLHALPAGRRGWVTIEEARRLFSPAEGGYAFGEADDEGKAALAAFAEQHRSRCDFMPAEGRLYFTRA